MDQVVTEEMHNVVSVLVRSTPSSVSAEDDYDRGTSRTTPSDLHYTNKLKLKNANTNGPFSPAALTRFEENMAVSIVFLVAMNGVTNLSNADFINTPWNSCIKRLEIQSIQTTSSQYFHIMGIINTTLCLHVRAMHPCIAQHHQEPSRELSTRIFIDC